VPEHHKPGEPAVLTIEEGERLQEKRSKNAASRNSYTGKRKGSSREYNEQRGAGYYKSRDRPSKKSRDSSIDDLGESKPVPAKDPWGNFKGGK